jgi:hypothetical protein
MAVATFALILQLVAASCFVPVLLHAFKRSVGTGFLVLFLPVYSPYYAFSQFEHRFKGVLLAGWLGGFVLAIALRMLALQQGLSVAS